MAIPNAVLSRLMGRSSRVGEPNLPQGFYVGGASVPGYTTLDRIKKEQEKPPKDTTVIPQRYQRGGVANRDVMTYVSTDAQGNPSWVPARSGGTTGSQASGPDYYQDGGVVGDYNARQMDNYALTPAQQQIAYRQSVAAVQPTYQLPAPGAASYYYVDPRAAAYGTRGYNPMTAPLTYGAAAAIPSQADGRAVSPPSVRIFHDPTTGAFYNMRPGYPPMQIAMPGQSAPAPGYAPEQTPQFQGGGVVNPALMAGLSAALMGGQAPQPQVPQPQASPEPQASPVAGEPAKKKQPRQQGPPKYTFGPPGYWNAPAELAAMREEATQDQGMQEGGIVPQQFMQWLARGGVVDNPTPDHHLMFWLGAKYGLNQKQARKSLDTKSRSNNLPP